MTAVEIVTVLGCLVLGYWIMAVFIPSLMDKDTYSEDPQGEEDSSREDRQGSVREKQSRAENVHPSAEAEGEEPWHELLGVAEDATRDQISAAYKRRIREYHPDRVAQMGPEIRDLAERKSRQINAAYEQAMGLRGIAW